MSDLIIHGGIPLRGELRPSSNKNAVLPILCATLFAEGTVRLCPLPDTTDVRRILDFFRKLGSRVEFVAEGKVLEISHDDARFDPAEHTLPVEMRSSIMLVPGLLHRFGTARIERDVQGCTLGVREIDPHIEVFRKFGVHIDTAPDCLILQRQKRPQAQSHWLEYASVTTTENFIFCALIAEGTSLLMNAASEPHVQEVCRFLERLGAKIDGIGTSRLRITGLQQLGATEYEFEEDYHEIVTMMALGAITGGDVRVKNSVPEHFPLLDRTFAKFGVTVEHADGWSHAQLGPEGLHVQEPFTTNLLQKVEAAPWPYVPADLLPIFIALGVAARGGTLFWNKVYDGALGWTSELSKFGAHVVMADPHRVITFGGKRLTAATVESPYIIRVAIALLMVASGIPGHSVIRNASPIKRAHPHFDENLRSLGAQVEWKN